MRVHCTVTWVLHPGGEARYYLRLIQVYDINTAQLREPGLCSSVEFLYRQEMAYFDARSKGLVQTNNSKHIPIDQYLHDRMTPATLSPTPLAYEKPIHPTEMPHNIHVQNYPQTTQISLLQMTNTLG